MTKEIPAKKIMEIVVEGIADCFRQKRLQRLWVRTKKTTKTVAEEIIETCIYRES